MPVNPAQLSELFEPEKGRNINAFIQPRNQVTIGSLADGEENAIKMALNTLTLSLDKISSRLAAELLSQEDAFLKWGQVAKGNFPVEKNITFPSQPGTIGVVPLFPQAIKYNATAAATANPVYTDYTSDSWDISVTAGSISRMFGGAADTAPNYYKAASTTATTAQAGNEFIVVAQNGVIEKGTTPKMHQWRLLAQTEQKYGVYTDSPLLDETIELGRNLYQHPTLGMIPVYRDLGIWWGFQADQVGGVDSIRLLGLAFFEHELFPNLTSI